MGGVMKSETTSGGTPPRKKIGRRPLFKDGRQQITLSLPTSVLLELEEQAVRAGRTRTEFTRELIMTALENIKKEESGA